VRDRVNRGTKWMASFLLLNSKALPKSREKPSGRHPLPRRHRDFIAG